MARKLASIVEISKVSPIEGADKLEVAEMVGKGWKVVTAKGEVNPGDLCVYFEIDSFLDPNDERYAFLKDRCLRRFVSKGGNVLREGIKIKTIKLRGQISQGLLMPLDKFIGKELHFVERPAMPDDVIAEDGKPVTQEELEGVAVADIFYFKENSEKVPLTDEGKPLGIEKVPVTVGSDLTEVLHVEHYDEVKESLQPEMGNPICADALGRFPSDYIPKTDEERIQNLGDWFEKMKGRRWQVSCKHDGTSCTIAFSPTIDFDNPQIVCSRNLRLKRVTTEGKIPVYWQMAERYGILEKLGDLFVGGKEYAIQGEVVGPGINKCKNKETEYKFLCFRIWDIKNQKWLNPKDTIFFCEKFQIPHVQIVKDDFAFFDEITTMEDALKFAEGKTAEGHEREGIVCKTVDDGPFASFKIVSNKYLMKQED